MDNDKQRRVVKYFTAKSTETQPGPGYGHAGPHGRAIEYLSGQLVDMDRVP